MSQYAVDSLYFAFTLKEDSGKNVYTNINDGVGLNPVASQFLSER